MADDRMMRLNQVARQLNVGIATIVEHLTAKGFDVENNPNSRISPSQFEMLSKTFKSSASDKREASGLSIGKKHPESLVMDVSPSSPVNRNQNEDPISRPEPIKPASVVSPFPKSVEAPRPAKLPGITVIGKIDLGGNRGNHPVAPEPKKPVVEEKEAMREPVAPPVVARAPEPVPVVETPPVKPPVMEPAKTASEPKRQETTPPVDPLPVSTPLVAAPVGVTPPVAPVVASIPVVEPQPVVEPKKDPQPPQPVAAPVAVAPVAPPVPTPVVPVVAPEPQNGVVGGKAETLKGLTVLGRIELPTDSRKKPNPVASSDDKDKKKVKRKRKRVRIGEQQAKSATPVPPGDNRNRPSIPARGKPTPAPAAGKPALRPGPERKEEVSDKQIQDQIKATLAKLSGNRPNVGAKMRQAKRRGKAEEKEARILQEQEEAKTLKVTEFISANDLASLMNVSVNEVISACLGLGMFVSINQRLDAEAITVITDEFGFDVEFTSAEEETDIQLGEVDEEASLIFRAPIVTIMGHVDHGKTSLLDYIRSAKVAAGEAGGITQHIGAYDVMTDSGKRIAFLDTPGHEAFTAMRARGAKVTDVVIIVVAADDNVMPQTKEAINHAQVAGVPIVIAINKVDKANANPEKIKEELAKENILVEDWGGKYQSEDISAKTGKGISELLEKVLLEAELLDLKANPNKKAVGTVIEASLDKGRGYVTTVLVQSGTLKVGDILLAGAHHGRVKAMTDHRGKRLLKAGPSTPAQVLGLSGAPQAGDKFNVVETEREAREISNKREQILREQSLRTRKHITLEEIGRRKAIGTFKELNVIIKGDVDGSIEALSDSLLRLSTEEVQVRIIHKAVGPISESDVLLASASDAVIVGFQVRPSTNARRLAEQEEIEIRLYSIIYDAINEVKDAMEGMLAPKLEEIILATAEVRMVFKITKVGTVAGSYVTDGTIKRNAKIRVVRDGIVVHTGDIDALKRLKDDVSEVKFGYECGISIKNFNDILEGDVIESFEQRETKRTL
ncbi:MAG: translation initiation factor IF-2 [Ferruginibacter sp.]|nr:translation initiation factor IF-2 [Cytophagales bacterium]